MIKMIEKRICDFCKKEVQEFAGSLKLRYSDRDYMGNGFPVQDEYTDLCIDCCRLLDKIICDALKKKEEEND